jgi:hypothetical protein
MRLCVGYVALDSKFHVMMAYVNYYYNDIGTMIYYMLHLHKTHVSHNKIQKKYGINIKKETMLCYGMV